MELKEISIFEAREYDLPAREAGKGEMSVWYALEDEDTYKGFMEVTEDEEFSIKDISYFMVPDIYQGNNYGNIMLSLFLNEYIPGSAPEDLLTAAFEYNTGSGEQLDSIFSGHGFDITLRAFRECSMPFDAVYKRLATKKPGSYKGRMANLSVCINDVLENLPELKNGDISQKDIRDADIELSVAAVNSEGKLEALMLVSSEIDGREAVVSNLYTATDNPTVLRRFLAFTVDNAARSLQPPEIVTFVAANEKLEQVMDTFFDHPQTSQLIVADAEFNLGKYVEQLKLLDTLRR